MCAFPGCQTPIVHEEGTVLGEICHIRAQSVGGPRFDPLLRNDMLHSEENLILLCSVHHKIVDDDAVAYDILTLQGMKSSHISSVVPTSLANVDLFCRLLQNRMKAAITVAENSGNVAINSPGVTQGQIINIQQSKGRVVVAPPAGTLGANPDFASYIGYLISRYNKFASMEKSRSTRFNFAAISRNLENELGCTWKLASEDKFQDAIDYLIRRIERTRQARLNKSRGYLRFSTFEEHVRKRRS